MRFAVLIALSVMLPVGATAQEKSSSTQPTGYNWQGLYFGGHVGLGFGKANAALSDTASTSTSNNFGGPIGGVQLGYNFLLPSHVLLGWELDASFPNYIASNSVVAALATAQNQVTEQFDYMATARGRFGYAFGPWLFYGTGGIGLAGRRFINDPTFGEEEKILRARFAGVAGAGVEYAFDPNWTMRLEYLHGRFAGANVGFPPNASYASNAYFNMVRLEIGRAHV